MDAKGIRALVQQHVAESKTIPPSVLAAVARAVQNKTDFAVETVDTGPDEVGARAEYTVQFDEDDIEWLVSHSRTLCREIGASELDLCGGCQATITFNVIS